MNTLEVMAFLLLSQYARPRPKDCERCLFRSGEFGADAKRHGAHCYIFRETDPRDLLCGSFEPINGETTNG